MKKNRQPYSTFDQRQAFMLCHPELNDASKMEIVKAMKKAGLVAPTTYVGDVRIWQRTGSDIKLRITNHESERDHD